MNSIAVSADLTGVQQLLVFGAVAAVGLLLWIRRIEPVRGAALIWLAIFVANPNFAWHYLIWGLPFFLMSGFVRETLIFSLLAVPALVSLLRARRDQSRLCSTWSIRLLRSRAG